MRGFSMETEGDVRLCLGRGEPLLRVLTMVNGDCD